MKKEKLQQTPQKHKGSQETTIRNYMPIKQTKLDILKKIQPSKTEAGTNRKYEQANHKHHN